MFAHWFVDFLLYISCPSFDWLNLCNFSATNLKITLFLANDGKEARDNFGLLERQGCKRKLAIEKLAKLKHLLTSLNLKKKTIKKNSTYHCMNISYTLKGVIKSSIGHFCQNLKEGAHAWREKCSTWKIMLTVKLIVYKQVSHSSILLALKNVIKR